MNRTEKNYEPPRMQVYRFDNSDLLLTASGETPLPPAAPNYAANALNELFGGTNTTIEN